MAGDIKRSSELHDLYKILSREVGDQPKPLKIDAEKMAA